MQIIERFLLNNLSYSGIKFRELVIRKSASKHPNKKRKIGHKMRRCKKPSNFASAHQSRTSFELDVTIIKSVLAMACLKIDLKGLRKTPLFWTFGIFFKNVPRRFGPSETNFTDLLDELFPLVYTVKK